jgi:MinD superfamily P-loop ATPase
LPGDLAAYFQIPRTVCINKWDLNPDMAEEIADYCQSEGMPLVGKIPYDRVVSQALVQRKILVEYDTDGAASREVRAIWERVQSAVYESFGKDIAARTLG